MVRLEEIKLKEHWQKYYDLVCRENPYWKENYVVSCMMQSKEPLQQGNLTDFQFFCITRAGAKQYLLLDGEKAVTLVWVIDRNGTTKDIGFSTAKEEQRKGYATLAVSLIERILFADPTVAFLSMVDMSENGVTSKIAEKRGYMFSPLEGIYLKVNPNLTREQVIATLTADCGKGGIGKVKASVNHIE